MLSRGAGGGRLDYLDRVASCTVVSSLACSSRYVSAFGGSQCVVLHCCFPVSCGWGVFKIVLLLLSRCVLAGLVCLGELCRAETTAGMVGGALYTRVRGGVSWVPLKLGSDHSVISNLSICTL